MPTSKSMGQLAADAPAQGGVDPRRLDSIRQTLLWKLAPGLRHAVMGRLQALRWSAEATARMLQGSSDLAQVREHIDVVLRESTSAMKSIDALIEWFRPNQDMRVPFNSGIGACVKLASEDWFLRGIQIKVELADTDLQIPQRVLQETVVTALLVLTDQHTQNADFLLTSEVEEDFVRVALTGSTAPRNAKFSTSSDDRTLAWSDLELLATVHAVECVPDPVGATLRFSRTTLVPATKG
jgi:hypothetical protein